MEVVGRLQSQKEAQGLTLQSFLVLPMQRITRLPLLVNVSTLLLSVYFNTSVLQYLSFCCVRTERRTLCNHVAFFTAIKKSRFYFRCGTRLAPPNHFLQGLLPAVLVDGLTERESGEIVQQSRVSTRVRARLWPSSFLYAIASVASAS